MRGYFEIGIIGGKTPANVGTLWRSAFQLGATGIYTIGARYRKQASDTPKAWRHVPLREYADWEEFIAARPYDCPLVVVEMGGNPLATFRHPERAIYLLGAEDNGVPPHIVKCAQHVVSLPAVRTESYNVAVAGSVVMYDRLVKAASEAA